MVREGLRLLLETAADIQVVGEAANGQQSVRETKRLKPDVVVQDLAMPLLNGLEAARQIAKEVPSAKVLILSAYTDDQYIEHAIEAGAAGYLMKESVGNDLLTSHPRSRRRECLFQSARCQTFIEALSGKVFQWLLGQNEVHHVDQSSNGSPPVDRGRICHQANSRLCYH